MARSKVTAAFWEIDRLGKDVLGGFEHQILLTILRLEQESYTVPIVLEIERQTGREVAPAAVYIALTRLEKKGLLESRNGDTPDTGGRPRRYFRLTPPGLERLRDSRRTLSKLSEGVEAVLDEGR